MPADIAFDVSEAYTVEVESGTDVTIYLAPLGRAPAALLDDGNYHARWDLPWETEGAILAPDCVARLMIGDQEVATAQAEMSSPIHMQGGDSLVLTFTCNIVVDEEEP